LNDILFVFQAYRIVDPLNDKDVTATRTFTKQS